MSNFSVFFRRITQKRLPKDYKMNFEIPFSPLLHLDDELFSRHKVKIYIKRDDLIHPSVHGNKWRKLKYNLLKVKELGITKILTFGGAFSNHIYATAAAAQLLGLESIGIIRGEKTTPLSNTLTFAEKCGMTLHYVSRSAYRNKEILLNELTPLFGDFYFLPEGGTNALALLGCAEIVDEINQQLGKRPNYICVACGTGGTMSGIVKAAEATQEIVGFSILKGDYMEDEVTKLIKTDLFLDFQLTNKAGLLTNQNLVNANWRLNNEYHFGGYAKWTPKLIEFINDFKIKFGVQLDPIYTGKMFFGVFDLIEKGYFAENSMIVLVHTGGLQGIEGFNELKLKHSDLKIV